MDHKKTDRHGWIKMAVEASLGAGAAIMRVYESTSFSTRMKSDQSPITRADEAAHRIISGKLRETGMPVLSEEGRSISYRERSAWKRFWMVDPLDGTREFIAGNGEFTVNIALIEDQFPLMGVVLAPALDRMYFAASGMGAWLIRGYRELSLPDMPLSEIFASASRLPVAASQAEGLAVVASRSHMDKDTEAYISRLESKFGKASLIPTGSAIKICLVAEGSADIYPRFGPTSEWDIAAGHAIASEAGCSMVQYPDGSPVRYNKEDLINPFFIVSRGVVSAHQI